MKIIELNQNEISVVSGKGKITDAFNTVGGCIGGLAAATWLTIKKIGAGTKGGTDENNAYWNKQFTITSIAVGTFINVLFFYIGNRIFKPIDSLFLDDDKQK